MLQKESNIFFDDSTDAQAGIIIGDFGKPARLMPGDKIKVSIRDVVANGKITKGTVSDALIISTRQYHKGNYGIKSKASRNAAILLGDNGRPVGKVTGFVHVRAYERIMAIDKETDGKTVISGVKY